MALNRRDLLKSLGGACSALALSNMYKAAGEPALQAPGSRSQAYQIPDWFRDAKFGIWSHWGPQSAIEDGDWYARNMYMQGSDAISAITARPTGIRPRSATRIW